MTRVRRFVLCLSLVASALTVWRLFTLQHATSGDVYSYSTVSLPSACPEGGFVTINPTGRLGNKLCQYATLWALYRAPTETRPAWIMPEMHRDLSALFQQLQLPVLSAACAQQRSQWRLVPSGQVGPPPAAAAAAPVLVKDHPCSLTSFHRYRGELLRQLRWRPQLAAAAETRLRSLTEHLCRSHGCTYVAVHVRRTDYAKLVRTKFNGSLVGTGYLERALQLCRRRYRRPVFVVSSDDLAWCRQHLVAPDVVMLTEGSSAGEDLALMASCNHTVMTHGTYGFWAAYLAGGNVVVPVDFGARDSNILKMMQQLKYNVTTISVRK